jgi:glycosyltransferase involved in cell wall biosynthesis
VADDRKLRIIFPQHERFMIGRAHDNAIIKMCHALARYGHQVFLLMGKTSRDPDAVVRHYGLEPLESLRLIQLPVLRRRGNFGLSWHGVFNHFCTREILRLRQDPGVDLIYIREMKLARYLIRRRGRIGLPIAYEIHGLRARDYVEPDNMDAEVFNGSDVLITTTEVLRKMVTEIYAPSAPVHHIPLAAGLPESFTPLVLPSGNDPWRIGYIGQLHYDQGVDILVRSLSHLPRDVTVDIIGGNEEDVGKLRQIAREENVAQRVTFHGFCPPGEVAAKAAGAHLYVLPCRSTKRKAVIAHLKVYEYMALGRPVIGSDLPSTREEIEEGVTGLLFKPGDPVALAHAIASLVSDPPKLAAMALNARKAAANFTYDARAERLTQCFKTVIAKKR